MPEQHNSSHKRGNVALYAIVFLLVGIIMSLVIFFPQFLNMQSGIYGISCREIRQKIQVAIEDHDANNSTSIIAPEKRVDLDTLKERGFLHEIKLCPEKGEYKFDKRGRVICTFHKTGDKQ